MVYISALGILSFIGKCIHFDLVSSCGTVHDSTLGLICQVLAFHSDRLSHPLGYKAYKY